MCFLESFGHNKRMSIWNWWAFGAACAWILYSLVRSPVYAVIVLSPSGYGVSVGFFLHTGAIQRAQKFASGIQKKKSRAKRKIRREIVTYLIRRVRIERIFVSGVISFEDAMYTALAWGSLNALSRIQPLRIQLNARPDFSLGRTNIEITGILSVPAGHIMSAAVKHASIAIRERFNLWTSIRLKA